MTFYLQLDRRGNWFMKLVRFLRLLTVEEKKESNHHLVSKLSIPYDRTEILTQVVANIYIQAEEDIYCIHDNIR